MKINADSIRKLMKERKISDLEMCVRCDIRPPAFGILLHSGNMPEDVAVPIAEVLGVSLEEITGTTNSQAPTNVNLNSRYIRELMGSKGMAVADLARMVGVGPDRMKRELDNGTMDAQHAKWVAENLNVPLVEITLAY